MGKHIRSPKNETNAVIQNKLYIITKNGCWEFPPWSPTKGYPTFNIHGKSYLAHREVYRIYKLKQRAIPAGMFVCHHCDNPPCFNPEHLYLGTPQTNSDDCITRGRSPHMRFTALSADDISDIRGAISSGHSPDELIAKYKISWTRLLKIARGKEQPTKNRK